MTKKEKETIQDVEKSLIKWADDNMIAISNHTEKWINQLLLTISEYESDPLKFSILLVTLNLLLIKNDLPLV